MNNEIKKGMPVFIKSPLAFNTITRIGTVDKINPGGKAVVLFYNGKFSQSIKVTKLQQHRFIDLLSTDEKLEYQILKEVNDGGSGGSISEDENIRIKYYSLDADDLVQYGEFGKGKTAFFKAFPTPKGKKYFEQKYSKRYNEWVRKYYPGLGCENL